MRWVRIVKDPSKAVKETHYQHFKEHLAEEGSHQCVYCAIPESEFGGIWNFHVEHYRPKSHFESLIHDLSNLYYACAICNVFKGNDWPGEPNADLSIHCYPEPSSVDYGTLFREREETGFIEGLTPASQYVAERIYLNRPQLVMERRTASLHARLKDHSDFALKQGPVLFKLLEKDPSDSKIRTIFKHWLQFINSLLRAQRSLEKSQQALPYKKADVSRPRQRPAKKTIKKAPKKATRKKRYL